MVSWSGLFDRQYGQPYAPLGTNNTKEFNATEKATLTRAFRGRGNRMLAAVVQALTGAAVGGAASATYKQVAGDANPSSPLTGGGVRTVSTSTDVGRVTTVADQTLVVTLLTATSAPTYPVDRSGSGGGGKLGTW